MNQVFSNNASSTLEAAINATDTSLVVLAGQGDLFPETTGGAEFFVTLAEFDSTGREVDWEICRVTNRVGKTLTILRGQDGTAARAWPVGTRVELRVTAATLGALADKYTRSEVDALVSAEAPLEKATLTKSFIQGEEHTLSLSSPIPVAPVVSVTMEVPQLGVTNNQWAVNAVGSNYDTGDVQPAATLTFDHIGNPELLTDIRSSGHTYYEVASGFRTGAVSDDGLKMYVYSNGDNLIRSYDLSPAYDLASGVADGDTLNVGSQDTTMSDMMFKPDGTKLYMAGTGGSVFQWTLSTPWDLTTASYDGADFIDSGNGAIGWSVDGLYYFGVGSTNDRIRKYAANGAWNVVGGTYQQQYGNSTSLGTVPTGLVVNEDGTKIWVTSEDGFVEIRMSTPYDLSTASDESDHHQFDFVSSGSILPLHFIDDYKKLVLAPRSNVNGIYLFEVGDRTVTRSDGAWAAGDVNKVIDVNGGRIQLVDTSGKYRVIDALDNEDPATSGNWTLRTAVAEDGEIKLAGYDPANWSIEGATVAEDTDPGFSTTFGIFVVPDGSAVIMGRGSSQDDLLKLDIPVPWDFSSYNGGVISLATNRTNFEHLWISPDGLRLYWYDGRTPDPRIQQYYLPGPWDLSERTYTGQQFISSDADPLNFMVFADDGTKLYLGGASDKIYQYTLVTTWDVGSAVLDEVIHRDTGNTTQSIGFGNDGRFVVYSTTNRTLRDELKTPWDLRTAVRMPEFTPLDFNRGNCQIFPERGIIVGRDGDNIKTMALVRPQQSPVGEYAPVITSVGGQIDSEFWTDVNSFAITETVNDGEIYYAYSVDNRVTWQVIDNANGERPIARNNGGTWQYNSNATYGSVTWTNATTNTEIEALKQALAIAANRMDQAQAAAVTDANHLTLGTTLDLMVAPYLPGNGVTPVFKSFSVNYDANIRNEGAVNGTDYVWDHPNSTEVRIRSLGDYNLRVRVV